MVKAVARPRRKWSILWHSTPVDTDISTMAEDAVVYMCVCGKKWVFEKTALTKDSEWKCKCGRTIVSRSGAVFSLEKK